MTIDETLWECESEQELRIKAAELGIDADKWLEVFAFREWKQFKVERTRDITREQMHRLTGCQSVEEFRMLCATMFLDDKLLMKSYPFLKWDD